MYWPSFRNVVAALSLACLPVVFAHEADAAPRTPTAAMAAARTNDYTWCLQYDGATDCSFRDRDQCAATVAGSAGECVHIALSAQPPD
jgi:hypothetical protein